MLKFIIAGALSVLVLASCGQNPVTPTPTTCWDGSVVLAPATCPVKPAPISQGTVADLQIREGKLFLVKPGSVDTEVKFLSTTTTGIRRANGQIAEFAVDNSGAVKGGEFATKVATYLLSLGQSQAFVTGDGRQSLVFTYWEHNSLPMLNGQRYIPGDKLGLPHIGGLPVDAPAAKQ